MLENQEADDAQNNRNDKRQNADAKNGTGCLMTSIGSVVADDGQTNTGQQTGHCLCSLHQEGLCGAGNGFIALAEFQLAVVDNIGDAAGRGAERQTGTEEQECTASNNSYVAGRANISADSQRNHGDNRQAASKQIYLLTGDVAGDDREQEQADHLKDNREAEYRVQVSSQTNFLEVINRECLEQLRCQIEGQQQTDERNQLVVLDDDAECFLETGLGSSRAGGRLFLDVEYGDADANDENNDDADGNGGEAGFAINTI